VSYDLAVWEGAPPADNGAALATYRELLARWQDAGVVEAIHARMRGEATPYDPTPAIANYVDGLLQRWPDIGALEVEEVSRWADAPLISNATGPLIYFAMVYSKADEAVAFAAELAAQHGLNCFDPQSERLLTPAASSSPSNKRGWRRKR
jgi:hypothetical protein